MFRKLLLLVPSGENNNINIYMYSYFQSHTTRFFIIVIYLATNFSPELGRHKAIIK